MARKKDARGRDRVFLRGSGGSRKAESSSIRVRPLGPVERWLKAHAVVLRSLLVFLIVLVGLMAIVHWADPWVKTDLTAWTARATASILWLLGAEGRSSGALVSSSVLSFRVVAECTALYPAVMFVAAVVAFPCSWRRKLLGLSLGVPALLLMNVIRLVSLCYVHSWLPNVFEVIHLVVWQSLIIFFVLLIWLVWAALVIQGDEPEVA